MCDQQFDVLTIENVLTQLNVEKFRKEQRNDPILAPLIHDIEVQRLINPNKAQFHIINGLVHELRRDNVLYVL